MPVVRQVDPLVRPIILPEEASGGIDIVHLRKLQGQLIMQRIHNGQIANHLRCVTIDLVGDQCNAGVRIVGQDPLNEFFRLPGNAPGIPPRTVIIAPLKIDDNGRREGFDQHLVKMVDVV